MVINMEVGVDSGSRLVPDEAWFSMLSSREVACIPIMERESDIPGIDCAIALAAVSKIIQSAECGAVRRFRFTGNAFPGRGAVSYRSRIAS